MLEKLKQFTTVYYRNGNAVAHGWVDGVSDDGEIYAVRVFNFGSDYRSQLVNRSDILTWEFEEGSNIISYAENELPRTSFSPQSQQQILMFLEDYLRWSRAHGDDGISADLRIMSDLARFRPLTPLTGEDDEWRDVSQTGFPLWQNVRYSTIFKTTPSNDTAYDIDGIIFIDETGPYHSAAGRTPVTFPYNPKRRYAVRK